MQQLIGQFLEKIGILFIPSSGHTEGGDFDRCLSSSFRLELFGFSFLLVSREKNENRKN